MYKTRRHYVNVIVSALVVFCLVVAIFYFSYQRRIVISLGYGVIALALYAFWWYWMTHRPHRIE